MSSHIYRIGERARVVGVHQRKNARLVGRELTIISPSQLIDGTHGYNVFIDGEPLYGNDGHHHFLTSGCLEPILPDKSQIAEILAMKPADFQIAAGEVCNG